MIRKSRTLLAPLAVLLLSTAGILHAQEKQAPQNAREAEKIERQRELDMLRGDLERKKEAAAKLKLEIDALKSDRAKLTQELIAAAARLRSIETNIKAAEAKLIPLNKRENEIQQSLVSRRELLAELLVALTKIGRNPPPAMLLRPEDTLSSVRSAILLNAVIPELRSQAEVLLADLSELRKLREEINAERERLGRDRIAQDHERIRLDVLVEERQRKQAETEKTLLAEQAKTLALTKQVDNVTELLARVEKEIAAAARAAEAARNSAESKTQLAHIGDPGRMSPAIPFAQARGRLVFPVTGTRVREYGTPDEQGRREKGLSVSSEAGTQVVSPCDGWVVYSGVFRTYGRLLIINAGGGYHVLLAGMEQITVELGQFVLAGEPVAVMGGPKMSSSGSDTITDPILFIEFRKDGNTIDPTPWWAETANEKARG